MNYHVNDSRVQVFFFVFALFVPDTNFSAHYVELKIQVKKFESPVTHQTKIKIKKKLNNIKIDLHVRIVN